MCAYLALTVQLCRHDMLLQLHVSQVGEVTEDQARGFGAGGRQDYLWAPKTWHQFQSPFLPCSNSLPVIGLKVACVFDRLCFQVSPLQ